MALGAPEVPRGSFGLVQPHFDDGLMAAGHILSAGLLGGPGHLLTVFGWSHHVAPGFTGYVSRDAVPAMRLREDATFCRTVGLAQHALALPDVVAECSSQYVPSPTLVWAIVKRLVAVLTKLDCTTLLCPRPSGSNVHSHHAAVAAAAAEAARAMPGIVLCWLDDLPYSRMDPGEPFVSGEQRHVGIVLEFGRAELEGKFRLMRRCYPSQMRSCYFSAVAAPAPGHRAGQYSETIWVPQATVLTLGGNLGDSASGPDGARTDRPSMAAMPCSCLAEDQR